jgi:hypothetical protein
MHAKRGSKKGENRGLRKMKPETGNLKPECKAGEEGRKNLKPETGNLSPDKGSRAGGET